MKIVLPLREYQHTFGAASWVSQAVPADELIQFPYVPSRLLVRIVRERLILLKTRWMCTRKGRRGGRRLRRRIDEGFGRRLASGFCGGLCNRIARVRPLFARKDSETPLG